MIHDASGPLSPPASAEPRQRYTLYWTDDVYAAFRPPEKPIAGWVIHDPDNADWDHRLTDGHDVPPNLGGPNPGDGWTGQIDPALAGRAAKVIFDRAGSRTQQFRVARWVLNTETDNLGALRPTWAPVLDVLVYHLTISTPYEEHQYTAYRAADVERITEKLGVPYEVLTLDAPGQDSPTTWVPVRNIIAVTSRIIVHPYA